MKGKKSLHQKKKKEKKSVNKKVKKNLFSLCCPFLGSCASLKMFAYPKDIPD